MRNCLKHNEEEEEEAEGKRRRRGRGGGLVGHHIYYMQSDRTFRDLKIATQRSLVTGFGK